MYFSPKLMLSEYGALYNMNQTGNIVSMGKIFFAKVFSLSDSSLGLRNLFKNNSINSSLASAGRSTPVTTRLESLTSIINGSFLKAKEPT